MWAHCDMKIQIPHCLGLTPLDEVVGIEPTAAQTTKKDAPVGHRGGAWWKECLPEDGQTRTRVRPPGPGDAGVNGAEESAGSSAIIVE